MNDTKEEKKTEELKKNGNFTQVYPLGWAVIDYLMKENSQAGRLYAYFAKNIEPTDGTVLVSQDVLAQELDCTTRTIRKYIKYLEDLGVLFKLRVQGSVYIYALNPEEVWKSWNSKKQYALFNTRVIIDKDINKKVAKEIRAALKLKRKLKEQQAKCIENKKSENELIEEIIIEIQEEEFEYMNIV